MCQQLQTQRHFVNGDVNANAENACPPTVPESTQDPILCVYVTIGTMTMFKLNVDESQTLRVNGPLIR